METPSVFNNYDIRGKYPDDINEALAFRLGRAVGTHLKGKGTVVVGRDTRPQSNSIHKELVRGLVHAGLHVLDIVLSPTDKIAVLTQHWNADIGIMVTASHHPWENTGFKILYTKGNGFSNEDMAIIKNIYLKNEFVQGEGKQENKAREADEFYVDHAVKEFKKFFPGITGKVVADACNGGSAPFLPVILKKLGAEVIEVNCSRTIDTKLAPEPEEENRKYVVDLIASEWADIAVGNDPDGDRVFCFDKNGRWISGDEIFSIVGKAIGAKKIAASLDTSKMVEEHTSAEMEYTQVGDIFVSAKGVEMHADFLGEPNGHYAIPAFSWYSSGTFIALILAALAPKLPELVNELPQFSVAKEAFKAENKEQKMHEIAAKVRVKYKVLSELDGIKFAVDNSQVLVRPSGTSAKIRMVVENKSADKAKEHFEILKKELFL